MKWHHFKYQIHRGHMKIVKIESIFHWVDILPKPVSRQKFVSLFKLQDIVISFAFG
jgi:hypothetical protein